MSNMVKVTIELEEGTPQVVELDIDLENLTMRESVRLEEILGGERFDRLTTGEMTDAEKGRPTLIRAMLYTKLKSQYPELELEAFDVDLEEFAEALGGELVELPKVSEGGSRP